jgi:nucleotide-binding universal stress UspA family protein
MNLLEGAMFRTILLPLDGSELSESAIPYAEAIARSSLAKLVLARAALAFTPSLTDPARGQLEAIQEAETYLQRLAGRLTERGVATEVAVPYGPAAEMILLEARLNQADLIVLASHGRTGPGRALLGSVADQVVRQAAAPVLLIPASADRSAIDQCEPRIMVALDGSGPGEAVLGPAGELASTLGGRLLLLDVAKSSIPGESVPAPRAVILKIETGEAPHARDKAEGYLDRLASGLRATGCPVEINVVTGDPATEIVAEAKAQRADIVALTTHGRGGLARLVKGSVAEALLGQTRLPLLLQRRAEAARASSPSSPASVTVI